MEEELVQLWRINFSQPNLIWHVKISEESRPSFRQSRANYRIMKVINHHFTAFLIRRATSKRMNIHKANKFAPLWMFRKHPPQPASRRPEAADTKWKTEFRENLDARSLTFSTRLSLFPILVNFPFLCAVHPNAQLFIWSRLLKSQKSVWRCRSVASDRIENFISIKFW